MERLIKYIEEDIELLKKELHIFNVYIEGELSFLEEIFHLSLEKIKNILKKKSNSNEKFEILRTRLYEVIEGAEVVRILWADRSYWYLDRNYIYYLLILKIFKSLVLSKTIMVVPLHLSAIRRYLNECLEQWDKAFTEKIIPISFILPIQGKQIEKTAVLDDNFYLVKPLNLKSLDDFEISYDLPSLLIYKSELKFDYETMIYTNLEKRILQDQVLRFTNFDLTKDLDLRFEDVHNLITVVNLSGIFFIFEGYFLYPPWWIEPDKELYYKLGKFSKDSPNKVIDFEETIKKIYPDKFKKALNDKKFKFIISLYTNFTQRRLINDKILDATTFLESVFTRGITSEVAFRFALNIALFISDTLEIFEEKYEFFKRFYDLRSSLIHGGNSEKKILKLLEKFDIVDNEIDIPILVQFQINQILLTLIDLFDKDKKIIDDIEQKRLFFLKGFLRRFTGNH